MLTNKAKILGVLLDVSLQHAPDGKRVLDHVKLAIADYLRETFDHDDIFYLYHPELTECLTTVGDQAAAIHNYETDGYRIKLLQYAFLQTLYVVAAEEGKKILLYVTDRTSDTTAIEGALEMKLNSIEDQACQFVVVGIGDGYNKEKYESLPVTLIHLDDPKDMQHKMNEATLYGEL